jgi:hypothetical protein
MQLIRQKHIFRADLKANPKVLYLFGDNELRQGLAGQAKEMRGEPNAVGIRTKRAPGMAYHDFWHDKNLTIHQHMLREDLAPVADHLFDGGLVVLPLDGLGTGFSRMKQYCPYVKAYLDARIELWLQKYNQE